MKRKNKKNILEHVKSEYKGDNSIIEFNKNNLFEK